MAGGAASNCIASVQARFFPVRGGKTTKSGNILPGTVVSTDMAAPYKFSFFLTAQEGIQGTVRRALLPTHLMCESACVWPCDYCFPFWSNLQSYVPQHAPFSGQARPALITAPLGLGRCSTEVLTGRCCMTRHYA